MTAAEDAAFVHVQTLDAPRALVWKAWTEAERLGQWFGPKGIEWGGCTVDLRPGGLFHYCLRVPGHGEMWGKFVYRDIVPMERLDYVVSFSDKDGGIVRHPMSETWPLELLCSMTLAEENGKTVLTSHNVPIHAGDAEIRTFIEGRDGMKQGTEGMYAQLEDYLAAVKD